MKRCQRLVLNYTIWTFFLLGRHLATVDLVKDLYPLPKVLFIFEINTQLLEVQ